MEPHAAFNQATRLLESGNLPRLQQLYESGDAAVKAAVLNGLTGDPRKNPEMGPGVVALACEGAGHPSAKVRYWACVVFQNQSAWGVNVASAVEPLLALLGDADAEVRRMAAYATGNVYKRRLDFSPHFEAVRRLLNDSALYVPEAAAKALSKMARAKHDIGAAVPDLVRMLASGDDYDQPRKEAASALLNYAKQSGEALLRVRKAVKGVQLAMQRKEVKRFLEKLDAVHA